MLNVGSSIVDEAGGL